MIPKIIHQFWIGEKQPPLKLIETWRNKHPDWIHMLWTEETLIEYFPEGLANQKQYDIMPELNGKCDIARYEILYMFGGFFIDADTICVNKLDDFFIENDSFSCFENELERGDLVAAGYLGCTKGNKLMQFLISELNLLDEEDLLIGYHTAWKTVGPVFLTTIIKKYNYFNITIYPSYFFIPEHCSGDIYTGNGKIYAKQLWGSTPESPFQGYDFSKIKIDEVNH